MSGWQAGAEYRVSERLTADNQLNMMVSAASFDGDIELDPGVLNGQLAIFYNPAFCGGDGGCGQHMDTSARFVKWRHHTCGGGCDNREVLYFGDDGAELGDDYNANLGTDFSGVWRYLYQRGACYFDDESACEGSATMGWDLNYGLTGRRVYHWLRPT